MDTLTSKTRDHKKYSPSQADRLFACPGSVKLIDRTPAREQTTYGEEGNIAHDILEAGLLSSARNCAEAISNSVYCLTPDDPMFDVGFRSSVNDALDYVNQTCEDIQIEFGDAHVFVERPVNPPLAAAPNEAGGYCDVAIYSAKARRLWVIDYKHGAGIAKAVIGNNQVKQYGAGFLYEENAVVDPASIDIVTLVIIQPRAFHPDGNIREYDTTPAALFDYLMELEDAVTAAQADDAPLNPGEEQCRFCPVRSTCPALIAKVVSTINPSWTRIQDVREPTKRDFKSLDLNQIAYCLQAKELIKIWMNGLESHAEELLRGGQDVPGQKLVETQARREWYGDEDKLAVNLAAQIGCPVDELYEKKLINITDAQRKITNAFKSRVSRNKRRQAAEDANKIFAYFTLKKSSGSLTMVSADDPRPAVNKAYSTFSAINGLVPPTPTREAT